MQLPDTVEKHKKVEPKSYEELVEERKQKMKRQELDRINKKLAEKPATELHQMKMVVPS